MSPRQESPNLPLYLTACCPLVLVDNNLPHRGELWCKLSSCPAPSSRFAFSLWVIALCLRKACSASFLTRAVRIHQTDRREGRRRFSQMRHPVLQDGLTESRKTRRTAKPLCFDLFRLQCRQLCLMRSQSEWCSTALLAKSGPKK